MMVCDTCLNSSRTFQATGREGVDIDTLPKANPVRIVIQIGATTTQLYRTDLCEKHAEEFRQDAQRLLESKYRGGY